MELEREFWEKGKEATSSYVAETPPNPPSGFHWPGVRATTNPASASVSYL